MPRRAAGVERQLAHGNAHAVRALVAQAQNALAVGHDDDADVVDGPVGQQFGDVAAVVGGDEQAARPAKDVAILLARLADRRRIDDGHHLFRVVDQDAVKERFIAIFGLDQIDVLFQVSRLLAEVLQNSGGVFLDG